LGDFHETTKLKEYSLVKKSLCSILLAVFSLFSLSANAVIIDAWSGPNGFFETYIEDGVKITDLDLVPGSSWNSYMSTGDGIHLDDDAIKIEMVDGSLFDILWMTWDYLGGVGAEYTFSNGSVFSSASTMVNFGAMGQGVSWVTVDGYPWDAEKQIDSFEVVAASIPEPGTLALLGIGLFGMGLAKRGKTA
jgi:hypothetical protein